MTRNSIMVSVMEYAMVSDKEYELVGIWQGIYHYGVCQGICHGIWQGIWIGWYMSRNIIIVYDKEYHLGICHEICHGVFQGIWVGWYMTRNISLWCLPRNLSWYLTRIMSWYLTRFMSWSLWIELVGIWQGIYHYGVCQGIFQGIWIGCRMSRIMCRYLEDLQAQSGRNHRRARHLCRV